MFKYISCCLLILMVRNAEMHSYHLGACPTVEPQTDFRMKELLGIWYVIEKTSTASSCMVYNITESDEPYEYVIEEISQHFLLALTPLKHGYHYRGTLRVPDPAVPAKMTVSFPLSVAGTSSFTVFMTDYDTYAAIFTCQKLTFAHRQSATILSRTKTLDRMYIDKIRSRLSQSQIDPFELSIIKQNDCPKNASEGFNININNYSVSAKGAADVIRKAGEKLGDGVEYISGKTKDVYNKITSDSQEVTTYGKREDYTRSVKSDVEWLP
ncbi:hypothetical protein GWI33_022686 [Rhynchophorus ferrugineus]|uniref:Apolipoprotein D n=1 Tax=Rhynchophorus ferrugineus TaxID=354439 RepID=A0A834MMH3_RHYFE|nr:hypothetical protein GWI33_022686 [Rhynchophorus ferrugineus]